MASRRRTDPARAGCPGRRAAPSAPAAPPRGVLGEDSAGGPAARAAATSSRRCATTSPPFVAHLPRTQEPYGACSKVCSSTHGQMSRAPTHVWACQIGSPQRGRGRGWGGCARVAEAERGRVQQEGRPGALQEVAAPDLHACRALALSIPSHPCFAACAVGAICSMASQPRGGSTVGPIRSRCRRTSQPPNL